VNTIPKTPSSKKNITFGISLAMTGDPTICVFGQEVLNALDMWIWWTNEINGGIQIKGTRVQAVLKWIDNFANTAAAQNMTQYLIKSEGVNIMFGPYGSSVALPVIAVSEANKMVLMESGASTTSLFKGTKYSYSTLSPASTVMPSAVKSLISMGARHIVTVIQNMLFTVTMASAVTSSIQEIQNPEITYYKLYLSASPTQAEIDRLIINMTRLDVNVDLLVGCVYYAPCVMIINTAKRLQFSPGFMLMSKCLDTAGYVNDFNSDNRRYILGAVQWSDRFTEVDKLTGWSPSKFSSIYKSRYNVSISYIGASYFAGGLALTQALQNAGSVDSTLLTVHLSRLQLQTFFGLIQFDVNGQLNSAYTYVQYDDQSNLQMVLPASEQTGPLIYPIPKDAKPAAFYQQCILVHGASACQCYSKGCPMCTRENYALHNVTSCKAQTSVRYIPTYVRSECQGGFSMPEFIPVHCDYLPTASPSGIVVQIFAYLGAVVSLVFVTWTTVFRKSKIVKASQPEFCFLTAVGGLVCSVSPVTSLGQPTTFKCRAHHCLFHLSFTLMMGCFFVRTFRVWRIFGNRAFAKYKFSANDTFKLLSVIMGFVVCILVIEFIVKPPNALVIQAKTDIAGPIPSKVCSTRTYNAFSYLLGFYEVLLILLACYFSFQNRNMPSIFSDSQHLLASVFEIAAIYMLGNLVSMADRDNFSANVVVSGVSTSLYCIAALCTFFAPKVYAHWNRMDVLETRQASSNGNGESNIILVKNVSEQTQTRGQPHAIEFRSTEQTLTQVQPPGIFFRPTV